MNDRYMHLAVYFPIERQLKEIERSSKTLDTIYVSKSVARTTAKVQAVRSK